MKIRKTYKQLDQSETRKTWSLIAAIIVMLLIILFVSTVYIKASQPNRQAKKEAMQIAEREAGVTKVTDFYTFNRQTTYYTIAGTTKEGQDEYVIIPKADSDVLTILKKTDGLNEQDAKQVIYQRHPNETIKKVNLGLYDEQPVWEIMTQNANKEVHYYLIDFKGGHEIIIKDNDI